MTYMTVTACGDEREAGVSAAAEEMTGLEKLWSVTDEQSEIYAIDHAGGGSTAVSDETAELPKFALDMHEKTESALDISLYPVLRAWGFTTGEYRVPDDEEIAELPEKTGVEKIMLGENTVSLPEGMEIDLWEIYRPRVIPSPTEQNGR